MGLRQCCLALLVMVFACGPTSTGKGADRGAQPAPRSTVGAELDCSNATSSDGGRYTVDESEARHNPPSTRISELTSTATEPFEVCTVPSSYQLLTSFRCDDGSSPFTDEDHARRNRLGNTGASGRCGHMVDQYRVPCPEKEYEIFIDPYVCKRSELPDSATNYTRLHMGGVLVAVPLDWIVIGTTASPISALLTPTAGTGVGAMLRIWSVQNEDPRREWEQQIDSWGIEKEIPMPASDEVMNTIDIDDERFIAGWRFTVEGETQLAALYAPKGSALIERTLEMVPILAVLLRKSDETARGYLPDLASLETVLKSEFENRVDGGTLRIFPKGFTPTAHATGLSAIKDLRDDGQLRYVYQRSESQASKFDRERIAMVLLTEGIVGDVLDWGERGYRVSLNKHGYRMLMAQVDRANSIHHFLFTGPPEALSTAEMETLFEAMIAATMTAEDNPDMAQEIIDAD